MKNIIEIAKKLNLTNDDIELYGNYKAKINIEPNNTNGNLILVTSINPTPYGEGKTTITIGINDALRKLGENSVAVLREPSLGPVFGIKGGATGGGLACMVPEEDINLHFTGDMHAITSCNNLLASLIDNHIYFDNELNINPNKVVFKRCIDLNDRALRNVKLKDRNEHFEITAASEIMAILCLSKNALDLKNKLSNILIGYSYDNKPIFVKDLKCENALYLLLKDAIKPNLVQSLENNPIIVHGGPFANIAHGCNSLIATKLGLSLADYVITEAGFGADLGGEKFYDIKCRNDINPKLTIINISLKALKYNAYIEKENIDNPDIEAIKKGIINLKTHIENVKMFTNNILVILNKFNTDTDEEINFVKEYVNNMEIPFEICEAFTKGGLGGIDAANKIVELCNKETSFNYLYELNDSIENKINKICTNIYRAKKVIYSDDIKEKIAYLKKIGFNNLPICIAKTQYSISNNPKLLGSPKDYDIEIQNIELKSGAGFIVVYLGNIFTLPGLNKHPNALDM